MLDRRRNNSWGRGYGPDREVWCGHGQGDQNKTMRQIVDELSESGKGRTREVKALAAAIKQLWEINEDLAKRLTDAEGGKVIRFPLSGKRRHDFRFWIPRRYKDDTHTQVRKRKHRHWTDHNADHIDFLNDVVLKQDLQVEIQSASSSTHSIIGPARRVRAFLRLVTYVNAALQEAFDAGYTQGKNLLFNIAKGEITVSQLSAIEKEDDRGTISA